LTGQLNKKKRKKFFKGTHNQATIQLNPLAHTQLILNSYSTHPNSYSTHPNSYSTHTQLILNSSQLIPTHTQLILNSYSTHPNSYSTHLNSSQLISTHLNSSQLISTHRQYLLKRQTKSPQWKVCELRPGTPNPMAVYTDWFWVFK
jgi:hypothetical protein